MGVVEFMVVACLVTSAVWALFVQDEIIGWLRNLGKPADMQTEVTGKRRNQKQTKQPTQSKLVEFWKSNPLWWVLGMLSAIALQHLSLFYSFVALWIVLTAESVRLKFFPRRWNLFGNTALSFTFAAL